MIYNDFIFSRLDFAPLHGHLRMLLFIDYVIMNQKKDRFLSNHVAHSRFYI